MNSILPKRKEVTSWKHFKTMSSLVDDVFGYFLNSQGEGETDERFEFPEPYFMWKEDEKKIPESGSLRIKSNTFKFLARCLASEILNVNEGKYD